MTWSRLLDTPLADKARERYAREGFRAYHTFAHVERLYHHVEHTLGLPYDAHLDEAIMVHDVIYDARGLNELRSVQWHQMATRPGDLLCGLPGQVDLSHPVAKHVMRTVDHVPNAEDNRIILADLLNFADPKARMRDTQLLRAEGKAMYEVSDDEWARANVDFLSKLLNRISGGLDNVRSSQERVLFQNIMIGIESTIKEVSSSIQSDPNEIRKLTADEVAEGWVYAGFWLLEDGPPKGEYLHLGGNYYAYRGAEALQFA